MRRGGAGLLGRDAGAAGQRVEGDALAEEDAADGPADGGAVGDGVEARALADVPLHPCRPVSETPCGRLGGSYVQSSWRNTSSTKGTPARMPLSGSSESPMLGPDNEYLALA